MIYLNEFDPHAAEWLRELSSDRLIPEAFVDDRSIKEVEAKDLDGFEQCHFFAGIGGWCEALRLAEWPDAFPVWTGSCPCQPFSQAGKGEGIADERHLWPEFFRLIAERRPEFVFGEQVESAVRHGWLDGVFADLEGAGYACGAAVLGAHSVGAPHQRQRLFWVAYAESIRSRAGQSGNGLGGTGTKRPSDGSQALGSRIAHGLADDQSQRRPGVESELQADEHERPRLGSGDAARRLVNADGDRPQPRNGRAATDGHGSPAHADGDVRELGDTHGNGRSGLIGTGRESDAPQAGRSRRMADTDGRLSGNRDLQRGGEQRQQSTDDGVDALGNATGGRLAVGGDATFAGRGRHAHGSGWTDFDVILCRDGKHRRIPAGAQPLVLPVVDGVRVSLDELWGTSSPFALENTYPLTPKMSGRVGLLRGAGNAIVPQVAAVFVRAFMESVGIEPLTQGVKG